MVNENYEHGWMRVPPEPDCQPKKNPAAKHLQQGDIVKPNCRNKQAFREHPRGVLLKIDGGTAMVRWEDQYHPIPVQLDLLIRVDG